MRFLENGRGQPQADERTTAVLTGDNSRIS